MKKLEDLRDLHTSGEILQQPAMWRDTVERIMAESEGWSAWLNGLTAKPDIILSGAGTSYYAALALQPVWRHAFRRWGKTAGKELLLDGHNPRE